MSEPNIDSSAVDWIIDHPKTIRVFQSHGIDYSCPGKSLEFACSERGLDVQHILAELQDAVEGSSTVNLASQVKVAENGNRGLRSSGPKKPPFVARIESAGRSVTPEDVWNAAVRAGVDVSRLSLSLSHVLGELTYEQMTDGSEDEPVLVRYTLKSGDEIEYDAGFPNPFHSWRVRQGIG